MFQFLEIVSDCYVVADANNLPRKSSKPPNAFVEIHANGLCQRTKTVPKSLNPSWNEDFQL